MSQQQAAPAGRIDHIVDVEVDLEAFSFDVNPMHLGVKVGDRVIWRFAGVPAGWTPALTFDGANAFGPFATLVQSTATVWGELGEIADGATLSYRPQLARGMDGSSATPASLVYGPLASLTGKPPDFGVDRTFHITRAEGAGHLRVEPAELVIEPGDKVTFAFDLGAGVEPGDVVPQIVFKGYEGEFGAALKNLFFGPFTSLQCSPEAVIGMGNNLLPGRYAFAARVLWRGNGTVRWLSSIDPTVDNMGPPPG